jgi:aspartate carbamoyltransferase catalytic subunit
MDKNIQHLRDIDDLSADNIHDIISRAEKFSADLAQKNDVSHLHRGKVGLSFFIENSTRTRISFEMAALRLGINMIHWDSASSSLSKGESFEDTIETLAALAPDILIMRHSEYNAPRSVARFMGCPVVNGGDSYRAHPTQALLDLLTIQQAKGDVSKLKIAICGDIAHSRVARSNATLLDKLGAELHMVAPEYLMPQDVGYKNATAFTSLDEGIKGCDVVMMLRLQKERMSQGLITSDQSYFKEFGLTHARLKHAKPDAIIMHPGPMNRGVEIDDAVADDPVRSMIRRQVANGVPTRMAVLDWLLEQNKG